MRETDRQKERMSLYGRRHCRQTQTTTQTPTLSSYIYIYIYIRMSCEYRKSDAANERRKHSSNRAARNVHASKNAQHCAQPNNSSPEKR